MSAEHLEGTTQILYVNGNCARSDLVGRAGRIGAHQVVTAADSDEALQDLSNPTFHPDSVWIEVDSVNENRFDLARRVRDSMGDPLPVVLLTDHLDQPSLEQAREVGASLCAHPEGLADMELLFQAGRVLREVFRGGRISDWFNGALSRTGGRITLLSPVA